MVFDYRALARDAPITRTRKGHGCTVPLGFLAERSGFDLIYTNECRRRQVLLPPLATLDVGAYTFIENVQAVFELLASIYLLALVVS